jgi:hypothetical protein
VLFFEFFWGEIEKYIFGAFELSMQRNIQKRKETNYGGENDMEFSYFL